MSGSGRCHGRRSDLVAEAAFLDMDEDNKEQEGNNDNNDDDEGYVFYDHLMPCSMLERLNSLRKQNLFCDLVLKASTGEAFPVHRPVLAALSNYFKAMLTSSLSESSSASITLTSVSAEVLDLILDFAYSSEVLITRGNVQNLLAACNMLEVLPLRDACCRYMQKHIDVNNCLGIQSFAEAHDCQKLAEKAREFALKCFVKVSFSEEFLAQGQRQLIELVSDDRLVCEKEEQVFNATIRWMRADRDQREAEFHRVLAHVRLPLLSPYFLHDQLDSDALPQSKECLRLVEEARLFHLLPDRRSSCNAERMRHRVHSGLFNCVVCVGGEDDKVVLRSVEVWNPCTKLWTLLPSLPVSISKQGLVVSGTNTLFLAGGEYPDGMASKNAWRFDPALNMWQAVANMNTPRSELGLSLQDGIVYAVGGWDGVTRLSSIEAYEVRTNSWTLLKSAAMKRALISPSVAAFKGSIVVCGGVDNENGDSTSSVNALNLDSFKWTKRCPMHMPRSGAASCVLEGRLFVIGGRQSSGEYTNSVERYDMSRDSWQLVCPMHERRYRPACAVVNNHVYVLGGASSVEGYERHLDTIERYDVIRDVWEPWGHLPSAKSGLSCVALKVKTGEHA